MQNAALISSDTIPAANPYWAQRIKRVFVNETEFKDVIAVNGNKGWISYFPRDDKGEIMLDEDGFPILKVVHGRVVLDLVPEAEVEGGD